MSKKISDFFRVQAKESKIEETSSNLAEIRKCRVILQDVNKEIQNGNFKNLQINRSESEIESNSCQKELTENCIKNRSH